MSSLILAFLIAFTVALLGVAMVRNSQNKHRLQREKRRGLIQRIETLPLPDIVQALGINFSRYFYSSPFEQLNECVQKCESCSSTQRCQNHLAQPELSFSELDFCPVRDHLGKLCNSPQ